MTIQLGIILLFGTILGSFLNVCIYRLPRKESIIWPNSHCPNCKCSIPVWCNIPIISYLFLGGKCVYCKNRIPLYYPFVEVMTGLLLLLVWRHYGLSISFVQYSILTLLLLIISFIDLKHKLILNILTLPGMIIGLIFALFFKQYSFLQALSGLILGGGFLWFVGLLGKLLFKKESMGGGDIKLGAMIGAFIGPQVVVALFIAFFLAVPVIAIGFSFGKLRMGSTLPFGPFLSLGTMIIVCYGQPLYQYYINLIGKL